MRRFKIQSEVSSKKSSTFSEFAYALSTPTTLCTRRENAKTCRAGNIRGGHTRSIALAIPKCYHAIADINDDTSRLVANTPARRAGRNMPLRICP
jgi:hypothetical protein